MVPSLQIQREPLWLRYGWHELTIQLPPVIRVWWNARYNAHKHPVVFWQRLWNLYVRISKSCHTSVIRHLACAQIHVFMIIHLFVLTNLLYSLALSAITPSRKGSWKQLNVDIDIYVTGRQNITRGACWPQARAERRRGCCIIWFGCFEMAACKVSARNEAQHNLFPQSTANWCPLLQVIATSLSCSVQFPCSGPC